MNPILEGPERQYQLFKIIKQHYKSGPLLERIKKYGGKPNWDKIRNYTPDELVFLIDLGTGDTIQQKEKHGEFYEKQNYEMTYELLEAKMKSNWRDFARALGDKKVLLDAMNKEEELKFTHRL